jgi:hypothetical protein
VYLIDLPLTIFYFLRAYRASVAHCVIVFIYSFWDRVDRILSPLTRREVQVTSACSLPLQKTTLCINHVSFLGSPEHNILFIGRSATRCEYPGRTWALKGHHSGRHDRWYALMASSRVKHPAVVVAGGLKKRLLSPVGYHRQTGSASQVAPLWSRSHSHNLRLKMYIFTSHSPSAAGTQNPRLRSEILALGRVTELRITIRKRFHSPAAIPVIGPDPIVDHYHLPLSINSTVLIHSTLRWDLDVLRKT